MIQRLKPKSKFSRNVLTLMTGTTIAQVIPITISPVLTRLYSPEDFGVFALFTAISSIFASIASGRYELAIMLPKKDEDAINIFALGFLISSSISLILLILVILFNDYFTTLLNNKEIGGWLYLVPIAVFFTGLFNILKYFNNRKKYYKSLAKASIIKSIIAAVIQLSIGFLKQGATGLITGQIVSQLFANVRLFKNITKDKLLLKVSKVKIIALAKKYSDFPKFSMPGIMVNVLMIQLVNILISLFYSVTSLGFYAFAQRIVGAPSSLVGSAIGSVYFQEVTKERQSTGCGLVSFKKVLKKLIFLSVIIFSLVYLFIEDIVPYVFGDDWIKMGEYVKILVPLFIVQFVASPMSIAMTVFERQKLGLYWQLSMFIVALAVIFVSDYYQFTFETYLHIITISLSLLYLWGLSICYYVSRGVKYVFS